MQISIPEVAADPGDAQQAAAARMANAIRALAMDAVEKANSGHPGMPMGMAEIAVCSGTSTCATIRRNPAGPTATASCCPTATARCCCTRCCT